jgi:hypothetical protein
MLNRLDTAVVRASVAVRESREFRALVAIASRNVGTVDEPRSVRTIYSPRTGGIVAWNFGTFIRPAVAPIRVNTIGAETVESYLARGGRILKAAPKVAKGAALVSVVRSRPTRIATSRG